MSYEFEVMSYNGLHNQDFGTQPHKPGFLRNTSLLFTDSLKNPVSGTLCLSPNN